MLYRCLAAALVVFAALYAWFVHTPKPEEPGHALVESTVEIAGRVREYVLFAPSGLVTPAALLLVFHGSMGDLESIRRRTGYQLEALAREEGFVVAYPMGVEGYWNGCREAASHAANAQNVDDVGFVRALVAELVASGVAEASRVYAIGFSNGGHMVFRLGLEVPNLVAGIATIGANLPAEDNLDCTPTGAPVRAVIVNGTDDPINPYGGGEVSLFGWSRRGVVRSAAESAAYFCSLQRCDRAARAPREDEDGMGFEIEEWWQQGRPVVSLVSIHRGGHTIPQSSYRFPRFLGATLMSNDVLEYMWRFLDAHEAGPP